MNSSSISAVDRHPRKSIKVLDSEISYVDAGSGDPVVLLHGNPTSSYLWRNVIPHLQGSNRCLAPDLIGMGRSGKNPQGSYRFVDHARYLEAWLEGLRLESQVTLVGHDWGSALAFHWARRNQRRVRALVYMEALVRPLRWEMWPEVSRPFFQSLRSPDGENMILNRNLFIEAILPRSVLRKLTEEEMAAYRETFQEAGESRRPMLTWPREIPFDGEPEDVHEIVSSYASWLSASDLPKLFINADPGVILTGEARQFCRSWPNQQELTVRGSHFLQEDSPDEIGIAIQSFLENLPA